MKTIRTVLALLCLLVLTATPAQAEQEATDHEYTAIFAAMTEDDYDALREVVYWESTNAGCPITTDIAVVRTVLNRVLDPEWPDTVSGVIYQRGQFWTKNFSKKVDIPEQVDDAINHVYLTGAEDFPLDSCYFATKMQSCAKDHQWIGGRTAAGKPMKGKGMYFARKKR